MKNKGLLIGIITTLIICTYSLYLVFNMNEINYVLIASVILVFAMFIYIWIYIFKNIRKGKMK